MTLGPFHERQKSLLDWFIMIVAGELKVERQPMGSTTWNRKTLKRAIEADLCYYFDPAKLAAALPTDQVQRRKALSVPTGPSGRPLIGRRRANREPADEHSATGAARCNHQREQGQIQNRRIRVGVQSIWQSEDMLDDVSQGYARPHEARCDPPAPTPHGAGHCSRGQQERNDDHRAGLALERELSTYTIAAPATSPTPRRVGQSDGIGFMRLTSSPKKFEVWISRERLANTTDNANRKLLGTAK